MKTNAPSFSDFISALQSGKFVAVSDATEREDETDLIVPAQTITSEQMAFMIRHTSGIIGVAMQQKRLAELGLETFETKNPSRFKTAFTMPVDLKDKTRGGVSAAERVLTVRALADSDTDGEAFGRPGHVFPLQAHQDGLRGRQGHTEAAMELIQKTTLFPAAVIGELMNDDGTMMRGEALRAFVDTHQIPLLSINDIIQAL